MLVPILFICRIILEVIQDPHTKVINIWPQLASYKIFNLESLFECDKKKLCGILK